MAPVFFYANVGWPAYSFSTV